MATKIDLRTLTNISEHPRLRQTGEHLDAATREHDAIATRHLAAKEELANAEQAAADGRRDEKRLRTAREALLFMESEAAIVRRRLATAQSAHAGELPGTIREVEQELKAAHRVAVQRLDVVLQEAQRISHEVATFELASRRLMPGAYDRLDHGLTGQHLPRHSWSEFGMPGGNGGTRYGYWRKWCRLDK